MSGHIAYKTDAEITLEVDVVVVGSGAGGATCAARLAQAGLNVAIVEAGAWRDPKDYPSSMYGAMRDLMDDWNTMITMGRAFWPIVQARAVGGTTVINSAICVRTPADIFARWTKETGVEDMSALLGRYQDEIERTIHVDEETKLAAIGHSNRLAAVGAKGLSYAGHPTRRYSKDCEGSGQCLQGCKGEKKQSLNITLIPSVLAREGTVLSCAPVERVLFEGKKAIGVTGRFVHPLTRKKGARFTVRAKKAVVVAASATHSAPLLHRSGVRMPALGKGFRAHPGTGVFGVYDDPVDMNIGTTQGWASVAYRESPGLKLETLAIPPELVAGRISGGGHALMQKLAGYRHLAMWCHAVRAETVGEIRTGIFGSQVHYSLDKADMERMRHGMVLLGRTHFAAGAKAIIPGIAGFQYSLTPDEIGKLEQAPLDPQAYVAILSHLFGGCTMGTDPKTSVVDARGRVHGYEHLVVADASVIPSNLGVNPQHTIMALAMAFADHISA